MAPHQQSVTFASRSNMAPTQFQSLGVLFDRPCVPTLSEDSHRLKSDSRLCHDLFQPVDTRMEELPDQIASSKSWDPCVMRDAFKGGEPEDRLAMEFAAALNSDHEDLKMSSHSRHKYLGNVMVESPWIYGLDVDGDVWIPPSGARCISTKQDFLSSCNFCYRSLANHDIFMYRGEKAFCSHECRHQHMVIEERNSKVSRRFPMVPCTGSNSDFLSTKTSHAPPVV